MIYDTSNTFVGSGCEGAKPIPWRTQSGRTDAARKARLLPTKVCNPDSCGWWTDGENAKVLHCGSMAINVIQDLDLT